MAFTVVIAPDSFKGSLDATRAARAIAEGWRGVRPDDELVLLPQADGGEGTLDAVEASVPGAVRRVVASVTGPDRRPVQASWVQLPGGVAVVELAESSGLPLMGTLDPFGATTRGLGEVIAAAVAAGATRLVVGLGGSASTDGGVGALEALEGVEPPVDGVLLLTDVTSPLLGPSGAAAVFGPQKGASALDVAALEQRLTDLADRWGGTPTAPGAGAAGGTAYGLATRWAAEITSGADYLAALTGLDAALARADALVTGEGRFDSQSLSGKVVGQLLAKSQHTPSVVIAGAVENGLDAISLTELAGSSSAAMAEAQHWLREAGAIAAQRF